MDSAEHAQPQTNRLRFATSAESRRISGKFCGSCAYLKEPVLVSERFVESCRSLFSADKDSVSVDALASLVEEVSKLSKSKLKCRCRKTGTPGPYGWTHLIDTACYAWQPREEPKP